MGERRKWDKQQAPGEGVAFGASFAASSSSSAAAAAATAETDPVLEKQMQYIKMLEERNRLKKKLAVASKKEQHTKQREDAFVTTFTQEGGGVRKNKSSTSLLPTKMTAHGHANGSSGTGGGDTARGRSAPSTTLPLRHTPRADDAAGGQDGHGAKQEPPMRRAKWSKPAAGASFGVESRNGKARLCVGVNEETKLAVDDAGAAGSESDEEKEEEESYLEESFEEFEADGRSDHEDAEEEVDEEVMKHFESKPSAAMASAASLSEARREVSRRDEGRLGSASDRAEVKDEQAESSSSSRLSQTTTELFSIIQNLSRTKQKTLVEVLQKFQSSEQQPSDVQQLRMSIGDPTVWQQVTAALFGASCQEETKPVEAKSSEAKKSALTVADVMEEQLKWEEEYARQMKERLAKEREAKEQVLREAEARRMAMLKQIEDEERELELLMERKRQERLAKLKALEEDDGIQLKVRGAAVDSDIRGAAAKSVQSSEALREDSEPAKSPASIKSPRKKLKKPTQQSPLDAKEALESQPAPIHDSKPAIVSVSTLNFSALHVQEEPIQPVKTSVEMRLRLLTTWGNTRAAGLTQICAYDANGSELAIDVANVKIYEQTDGRPLPKSHEMLRTISRLFSGVAQTTNEQEMWLGRLSDHGLLEIAFEVETTPSKLCVWNFNSKMCSACTRDIELLVNGRSVWSGSLPQGFGDEDDNVCTWITVSTGSKKMVRSSTAKESIGDRGKMAESGYSTSRPFVPETSAGSTGAPIWLSASSSTTSLMGSKPPVKADAKDDLMPDMTPRSGSVTSRRQRGERDELASNHISIGAESKHIDSKATYRDSKTYRSEDKLLAKETHDFKPAPGPHTSVVSPSWDTLEHFSKTSRSRLPSATEGNRDYTSAITVTEKSHQPSKFVPTTTSSLLAQLRGETNHVGSTSLHHDPVAVPSIVDIPELPSGSCLKLEIMNTWGDQYYVGLNGIEIFDHRGQPVGFPHPERQVTACPSSINVLDEYDDDPRVAKNLVDGVNCTSDDFHMWLAPYSEGEEHFVMLDIERKTSISMVRVWNYNKSRAHTFRGARHVRLVLYGDGKKKDQGRVIFEGEIKRAPGGIWRGTDSDENSAMWCEVILFTTDADILHKIEQNDELLKAYGQEEEEEEVTSAIVANVRSSMELNRPRTADNGSEPNNDGSGTEDCTSSQPRTSVGRPTTSAKRPTGRDFDVRKSIDTWMAEEPQQKSPTLTKVVESEEGSDEDDGAGNGCEGLVRGRRITIRLLSTWGDRNYIGLTQLDVLVGNHGTPLPLDVVNIDATPRDLASLGYDGDPRTLDKLINGVGTTCDDANMWLIPKGAHQEIRIDLKREQFIYGLRVWNYNKSLEDSFRGVKQISVAIDNELISPRQTGYILRKAPGNDLFDFDQIIRFGTNEVGDKRDRLYVEKVTYPLQNRTYKTPNVKQDYEPALFPQGFVIKLILWTTWGDPYYLGLNGIELYDFQGKRITTRPTTVTARPYSLSDIEEQSSPVEDVRVPENLLSGKNKNTWDASDAWLAPLASSLKSSEGNVVYIAFDTPIVLSLIKFWNYSKTPERGVKDLDIYLDDLHIFSGSLRKAPHGNGAQNVGRFGSKPLVSEEFSQPVLFSTNQAQVDLEKRRVYYCGTEEQDVLCINEGQVVQESKAMYRKPDPGAEGVVVDLGLRPMTAMGRK